MCAYETPQGAPVSGHPVSYDRGPVRGKKALCAAVTDLSAASLQAPHLTAASGALWNLLDSWTLLVAACTCSSGRSACSPAPCAPRGRRPLSVQNYPDPERVRVDLGQPCDLTLREVPWALFCPRSSSPVAQARNRASCTDPAEYLAQAGAQGIASFHAIIGAIGFCPAGSTKADRLRGESLMVDPYTCAVRTTLRRTARGQSTRA